jgi:hypothetical protein
MGTKINEELKSFFLKCTSAFTLDGAIIKAGQIVEVLEDDAKALLRRGKAVLAEVEEAVEDALGLGADATDAPAGDPQPTDDAGAVAAPQTKPKRK